MGSHRSVNDSARLRYCTEHEKRESNLLEEGLCGGEQGIIFIAILRIGIIIRIRIRRRITHALSATSHPFDGGSPQTKYSILLYSLLII